MRRFTVRLVVAFFTFALGIYSSLAWQVVQSRSHVLAPWADNIRSGVITESAAEEASRESSATQQLLAFEQAAAVAEMRGNVDFFAGLETDGYVVTNSNGTRMNRVESLLSIKNDADGNELRLDEMKVNFYKETAVVTGRVTEEGVGEYGPFAYHSRWTDVFVLQDGRWRLASTQVTPVEE